MIALETEEDRTQWQLLETPAGQINSGRVRYAAAMYFYQRGFIDERMLEAFRECAKRDSEFPKPARCLIAFGGTAEP